MKWSFAAVMSAVVLLLSTSASGFCGAQLGAFFPQSYVQNINLGPSPKLGACYPSLQHPSGNLMEDIRDPLDMQLSDRFDLFRIWVRHSWRCDQSTDDRRLTNSRR